MKTFFNSPLRASFFSLLSVTATLALFSSCKKDDGYQFEGAVVAKVQLVNASTDAGSVKLYIDNVLRTPNAVAFGAASGYNDSYTGQQDVSVQNTSGSTVATLSTQIDAANNYTYLLTGAAGVEALIPVKDDQTPPASGSARIRFVQASPNAASLNLVANGVTVFTGIAYKSASATADVVAGNYTFRLVTTGGGALYTSGSVALTAGKTYTVYSQGLVEGSGATALGVGVISNN